MNKPPTRRSVGRPRGFDEGQALEAAMQIFWRKGFECTSMTDLCQCTGLYKGSLYQAFGDKRQLFMRALQHYADTDFDEIAEVLSDEVPPLQNLRALMNSVIEKGKREARGCFVVSSLIELAPHDKEVRQAIHHSGQKRLDVLVDLISQAQAAGEIRAELPVEKLAKQLMVTVAGGSVLSKGILEQEDVTDILYELIDSWM